MSIRLLYVEDELFLGKIVRESLESRGFVVTMESDGARALDAFRSGNPDICVLDVMLPNKDGFTIAEEIRHVDQDVPIIFLTAKTQTEDLVKGFRTGGNDYIRKPFSFEELLARIRVLLRSKENEIVEFTAAGITLNVEKHTVTSHARSVELTQKEFALLEYLLRNKGSVCRRTRIIEKVWDIHFDYDNSVIDVYINALRRKLDTPGEQSVITTVRGVGYKIDG